MARIVNPRDLVFRGESRTDAREPSCVAPSIVQHAEPIGAFGMSRARIVREHAIVEHEPGGAGHRENHSERVYKLTPREASPTLDAMFGIGMPELIVILVVALVVLGPARLPELARTLGKAMAEFRRQSSDIMDEFQQQVRVEEEAGRRAKVKTPQSPPASKSGEPPPSQA